MIPGDIGAEIARLPRAQVAGVQAAGTWRPAPAAITESPGSYATSLPLAIARLTGRPAIAEAEALASGLAGLPWVSAARATGDGYLTVTVTAGYLAGLASRIVAAGQAAANSDALAGCKLTAPAPPDLSAATGWEAAWRALHDALSGRLAGVAGAEVLFLQFQQDRAPSSPSPPGSGTAPVTPALPGLVGDAVATYGADAVGYALARTSVQKRETIARQLAMPLNTGNPFVAVRYAHTDAASALRWARDLALPGAGDPARRAAARWEPQSQELALLDALSWLPERVAAAARRRRPAEVAAYLEYVAGAWIDCRETCPALPFQGRGAPERTAAELIAARLCLADAARITLSCGLALLGVSAPERI